MVSLYHRYWLHVRTIFQALTEMWWSLARTPTLDRECPNNTSFILYAELSFTLRSIHLCQCSFYKIFVKFRNNKKNVLKIVLIIVNIYKDENKSLNSNQFSLKNDSPHLLENYFAEVKNRNDQIHF
jgi:hypothetical protein